jgi:peptidoglycan/LPS O-acetylase OafA/YrhL
MELLKLNVDYSKRVYGLDVFRAAAILSVVMGHGGFIIGKAVPGFPFIKLIDGVELFFVLSGFLIGTILTKIYETTDLSFADLQSFWKRRWLRTLPNYYLILIVNVILVYTGVINGKLENFNWKFIFFLQNFNTYFTDFFWESWSLTIEEWFYILTPISILLFHYCFRNFLSKKNILLISILFFIISPLLYRISISSTETDLFWYDVKFRKVVLTRLDAIMYGVFFSWLKFYYGSYWSKIKIPFFILGIILIYGAMDAAVYSSGGFFSKTYYFSLVGIGAAMLLPFADSRKSFNSSFGKVLTHISLISYSMYLVNLSLVAQVIEKNYNISNPVEAVCVYIFYWLFIIILSTLLYKYFEKPVMDLRNRNTIKIPI